LPSPLPTICVLAGGLATRLADQAANIPKSLVDVGGEPFIFRQLRALSEQGASEVVVCVGHLGEKLVDCVGNQRFGLHIAYRDEGPRPLGTLGAIRNAAPLLGERFLVLYGDTFLRLDYAAAAAAWQRSGSPAMMTVLRNDGRWGVSNASFDGAHVTAYDKWRPTTDHKWIDYGLGGLTSDALAAVGEDVTDLADLYHVLAASGLLFGFQATDRFYEIGTPEALRETRTFFSGERHQPGPQPETRSSSAPAVDPP
jgi:NDP-sugar pyrophosphorylase family protein